MSIVNTTFDKFAEDLCSSLEKGEITLDFAYNRLLELDYKVTDIGCWYRTYTKKGSRKGYYIHLWGTNLNGPGKPVNIRFDGAAWGDKETEYGRIESHF